MKCRLEIEPLKDGRPFLGPAQYPYFILVFFALIVSSLIFLHVDAQHAV